MGVSRSRAHVTPPTSMEKPPLHSHPSWELCSPPQWCVGCSPLCGVGCLCCVCSQCPQGIFHGSWGSISARLCSREPLAQLTFVSQAFRPI